MDFDFGQEQRMLRDLVDRFASDRYDAAKRLRYVANERGFSLEGWGLLAEAGLLAFPFPEELGGVGGGSLELISIMESLGRGALVEPVLPAVLLGGGAIAHGGTEAQQTEWLPQLIRGAIFPALAHVEHQARFNLDRVRTRAMVRDGYVRLNGTKQLVLGGSFADIFIVSAVGEERRDLGLYLVRSDAQGVDRRDYRLIDGSVASDLILSDVEAQPMVGGERSLEHVLATARLAVCAELLGLAGLMFDATLDHVKTRNQFGQPLGSFQVIQHRMAENYTRLELSRSQLYRAAGSPLDGAALAAAKSFISANAVALGEDAIQLHGGIGTTEELMVGQAFKRVFLLASLFGDSEWELRRYNRLVGEGAS